MPHTDFAAAFLSKPVASVSVEMRVARTPQPKRGAGGSAEWFSSLRRGLSLLCRYREHEGLICVSLRIAFLTAQC
jgi:hypothetical protein